MFGRSNLEKLWQRPLQGKQQRAPGCHLQSISALRFMRCHNHANIASAPDVVHATPCASSRDPARVSSTQQWACATKALFLLTQTSHCILPPKAKLKRWKPYLQLLGPRARCRSVFLPRGVTVSTSAAQAAAGCASGFLLYGGQHRGIVARLSTVS